LDLVIFSNLLSEDDSTSELWNSANMEMKKSFFNKMKIISHKEDSKVIKAGTNIKHFYFIYSGRLTLVLYHAYIFSILIASHL